MTLFEKTNFDQADIEQIISSRLEESINIEFKSAQALSDEKLVKKEISKDVSSFSNSDGGLIMYGIDEVNHVASNVSFVDGSKYTKEWLENIILSNIQPHIPDLRIYPVRLDNEISKSIYVVKIPKSTSAPHINADKKYYKRQNFQSVPMEEYEIRNLYLTPIESSVVYSNIMMAPVLIERGFYIFDLEVHLTNKTRYVSEKYKVCMSFLTDNKQLSIDIKDNIILSRFQEGITISTKDLIPIFPKEVLSVLKCQVLIPVDDFDYAVANLETKLQVFSNHEIEEVNLKLNKVLKFNKEKAFGK